MTFTFNEYLLIWLFAVIFEAIYFYFSYRSFKRKLNGYKQLYESWNLILDQLKKMASFQILWKRIFNPLTYIIGGILFCIIAPIIFPFTIISLLKKVFGYKSKLQKKVIQENKEMKEAYERAKIFQEKEGFEIPTIIDTVKHLNDYRLEVTLSDESKKVIDLENFIKSSNHPLIKKYLDVDLFAQVYVDHCGALCWGDNDFDINPISIIDDKFTVKTEE